MFTYNYSFPGMEQKKSVRKCPRDSDFQKHFRFFDSSSSLNLEPDGPPSPENFESTFTLDVDDTDVGANPSKPRTDKRSFLIDVGLPGLCVICPLSIISLMLIALGVYGHNRIKWGSNVFAQDKTSSGLHSTFMLVDFSSSWLLGLTDLSSTIAGLVTPVMMMMQMYQNAQTMQGCSISDVSPTFPTAYQLSLMLGLASGNPLRLWRFLRYSRSTTNNVPPMLRRTAAMLQIALLLSASTFLADQWLHYTTSTVQIIQVATTIGSEGLGRGLTESCLLVRRADNFYEPCSRNQSASHVQLAEQQNEMYYLQHGSSPISSVDLVETKNGLRVALLGARGAPPNLDYRASTIAVSTTCKPITSDCDMRTDMAHKTYTNFNCSEEFWGILNKPPITTSGLSAMGPDVPPLAFKWSGNLQ